MRKNAKANTVTTIFTTKVHAEIELSAPENAQTGAEAQAYSAFSPVNSIIYIWNHNFPCLCRKIVLYFATSKGSDKIVLLLLHILNIDSVLKISYFGKTAERRRRKARWANASPNGEYAMTAGCTLTDVFACHCSVRLCWNGAFFVRGWLTIRRTFRAFCTEQGKTALLAQWDIERNLPLTPDDVTFGSHKRVWWTCPSGHSWQAMVYTRSEGTGCPVCAGRTKRKTK